MSRVRELDQGFLSAPDTEASREKVIKHWYVGTHEPSLLVAVMSWLNPVKLQTRPPLEENNDTFDNGSFRELVPGARQSAPP